MHSQSIAHVGGLENRLAMGSVVLRSRAFVPTDGVKPLL
ncbi:hypothetical protein I553_10582 [Mycobacterium xenopi 4042]|uniref:Uncharacterized protein n=1 Tax=Mycobacterium xenopi 4042 TaxID=1299334 RepID=X7ZDR4_MYCXE|nr:hypothetical protein I553_10582 [Mycobacterium xenopi 4042]